MQQYLVKKDQQDNSRAQDVVHPSEMAKEDWCPRQTLYRISGVTPTNSGRVHGHVMLAIFEEGNGIHTKWQSLLIDMGRMWGEWKCPVCDRRVLDTGGKIYCSGEGFGDYKSHTPVLMEYQEVPLDAEDKWLIHGHADGAVVDLKSFIEVKSIGLGTLRMEEPELVRKYTVKTVDGKTVVNDDALWKALKRPLSSHRRQALIYLAIANLLGWEFDKMIFIYEFKANQQTKEFTIPYREEEVTPLIDTALDIKWALEKGRVLPRPAELSRDSVTCKNCPFLDHCYGDNDETTTQRGTSRAEEDGEGTGTMAARPARGRVPRSARRPDRPERLRSDAVDGRDDEVGGVPERASWPSRGRRVVRRTRS